MPDARDLRLLDALLDSWDRNSTIMVDLLRALPESGLSAGRCRTARPSGSSPASPRERVGAGHAAARASN